MTSLQRFKPQNAKLWFLFMMEILNRPTRPTERVIAVIIFYYSLTVRDLMLSKAGEVERNV